MPVFFDLENFRFKQDYCTYLKHIIEEIKFDDGLTLDKMIHHRSIDVCHHIYTYYDDESLE